MVEDYSKIEEKLEENGYKFVRVKNTLANDMAPYRGLNIVVENADGYKFELQFHTPESLAIKEKNHMLYEKQRADDISATEYQKLSKEMIANSKTIPAIPSIESIISFDNLK